MTTKTGKDRQPSPGRRKKTATPPKKRSTASRIARLVMLVASIISALALFCSAYAGSISPLKYGGLPGVVQLTLPICLSVALFLLFIQLFFHRRGAVVIALAIAASGVPLLRYFPLNLGTPKAGAGNKVLKIMTYNVSNFIYQKQDEYDGGNGAMAYILTSGADIVCLQETEYIGATKANGITPEQISELNRTYPYIYHNNHGQSIFSKFQLEPIHLDNSYEGKGNSQIQACRISVDGKLITLFNVHLQSFALTKDEKGVYQDIARKNVAEIESTHKNLVSKLSHGNVLRAQQTQQLLRYIRHYGGPNVIVCGDFNDVPNSYAVRTLTEFGLSSVYPETGFGPTFTFNANRLYFCIDHILYRGYIRPLDMVKGRLKASDHYPLSTSFEILP